MQQDNIREEFRKFCNTDNFSAPPYETDTIVNWWLSHTISKQDIEKFVEENHKIGLNSMTQAELHKCTEETGKVFVERGWGYNQALDDLLTYIKNK